MFFKEWNSPSRFTKCVHAYHTLWPLLSLLDLQFKSNNEESISSWQTISQIFVKKTALSSEEKSIISDHMWSHLTAGIHWQICCDNTLNYNKKCEPTDCRKTSSVSTHCCVKPDCLCDISFLLTDPLTPNVVPHVIYYNCHTCVSGSNIGSETAQMFRSWSVMCILFAHNFFLTFLLFYFFTCLT